MANIPQVTRVYIKGNMRLTDASQAEEKKQSNHHHRHRRSLHCSAAKSTLSDVRRNQQRLCKKERHNYGTVNYSSQLNYPSLHYIAVATPLDKTACQIDLPMRCCNHDTLLVTTNAGHMLQYVRPAAIGTTRFAGGHNVCLVCCS